MIYLTLLSVVSAQQCLQAWPGLIIRTTESIANGAQFVSQHENKNQQVTFFFEKIKLNFRRKFNFEEMSTDFRPLSHGIIVHSIGL